MRIEILCTKTEVLEVGSLSDKKERTKEDVVVMKVFDLDYSLNEIERLLEEKMEQAYQNMTEEESKMIDSFDLSYEDYCYLLLKLKGLITYGTELELIEKYKISVVTALVYAIRYGKKENVYQKITAFIQKLPQHQLRYTIGLFANVAEEYALGSYKQCKGQLEHLFDILAAQAGENRTYYMSYVG